MKREANLTRKTKETDISLYLNLDGDGNAEIDTGIGFFDHMLTSFAVHAGIDLRVSVKGDIKVDTHHTVEDTGIVLGLAIKEAVGDKKGIKRFADAFVPMDDALAFCSIDICGRSFLVFNSSFTYKNAGDYETDSTEEFFRALAFNAQLNLHMTLLYGLNDHHKIEALYKAFARCLRTAKEVEGDKIPSSKGSL